MLDGKKSQWAMKSSDPDNAQAEPRDCYYYAEE